MKTRTSYTRPTTTGGRNASSVSSGSSTRPDVYQLITDRIIERLEAGDVPWQKPWRGGEPPQNLVTRKAYRGINVFLLTAAGFTSPYWLTYRQAESLGGHVKKGAKGYPVVFWKFLDYMGAGTETTAGADQDGGGAGTRARGIPFLRYYTVFNLEQCEGIRAPKAAAGADHRPFTPIEACERIVAGMPNAPRIQHGEPQAYYRPGLDVVNMPARELFKGEEEYYSTLFHELTHSTGHESRLDRPTLTDACAFGSTNYSKEELVAEMGAAFLCGVAGIENRTVDNSAAYLRSWLRRLRDDRKLLVQAAAQAQKAADYITGRQPAEQPEARPRAELNAPREAAKTSPEPASVPAGPGAASPAAQLVLL